MDITYFLPLRIMPHKQNANEVSATADSAPPSKRPIWTCQINRISGSIWKHSQKDGARYTYSISRSYFSKAEGKLVRSNFYDEQDSPDVAKVLQEIDHFLADLREHA